MSKKMAKGEESQPSSQRISPDAPKRPEVPKRPKWLSKLSKERKKPTKDSEPLSSSSKSSVNSSDTKDTFVSYNRIELAKVDKKPGKSQDRTQKGSKVRNQSAGKEKKAEFEKRDLSSGKGQRPWNSSTRLDKPRRRSDSHTSTDSSRSGEKRVNRFRSDSDFKTPRSQPKKSPSKESLTDSRKSSKQRRETDSPSRRETQQFYTAKKKDEPNYKEENKNREVSSKSPNHCDEQIDFNEKENTPDQPSKSWYEDEPQGLEELQYSMGDDRGPQKGKAHHWGDLPMDKHRDNNYRKPRKYIQEDSVEVRKNIRPGRGSRGRGGMVSSESQESISSRSSMQSQRPQRDNRKGHYHDNRQRDNRQTSRQSSVESLDRYARAPGSKPNSRPPSRPQSRNGPPQDYYYDDNHSSWAPPSRPLSRNGPLQHYNTDNKKSRYRGPPSRPISRQGSVESVDSYGGPPSRPNSRPPSRNGPPPQFWENNRKKGPPSRPLSRQGSIESLDSFGPSSRPSSRPPSRPPSRNGPPLPYAADVNWPRFNYAESVGSSSRRSSEVDSDDDFTFPSGEFWSTFPQRTSVENWSTWEQLPTDPRSSNSLPKKLSSDLQRELARQTAKEHRPKIGRRDSIESWDGFPRRTSFQDDRMYLSQPEDSGSARTHPGPRSRSRNRKRNRRNRRRSRSGQQGQGPFGHQNPNVGYSSASELSQDGDFKPPSDTEVQLRNRLDDVLDGSLSSGSMSPIPESDVAEFPSPEPTTAKEKQEEKVKEKTDSKVKPKKTEHKTSSLSTSVHHPLQHTWRIWYDRRENKSMRMKSDFANYNENLFEISAVETIEGFWQVYNHLAPAHHLDNNANYHFFRVGIMPMWEDDANKDLAF
ncbi:dentin sialophosphoprotein-like isoform X2 [Branchiostoma lanceolatum]|uniref:dentin sialophosphoprotein-like isoform X2 n=1 Tax=Branchiostoma lanceolatum TaxID=7740 RepID=UPI003452A3BD